MHENGSLQKNKVENSFENNNGNKDAEKSKYALDESKCEQWNKNLNRNS